MPEVVPDVNLLPLRVAVYGEPAADPAWLARLRALLQVAEGHAEIIVIAGDDAVAALRGVAESDASREVWLLRADVALPHYVFERLRAALSASDAAVVSVLDNRAPELSPLREGVSALDTFDALAVDLGTSVYGERRIAPTRAWSPLLSVWRAAALLALRAHAGWRGGALPDDIAGAVLDHAFVAEAGRPLASPAVSKDARFPTPASALDVMRTRMQPLSLANAPWFGRDGKRVVLHVMHGWGGGVERFVRDLARADRTQHHLALVARGDYGRRQFGEVFELILPATDATPLRRWPLGRPIAATALAHDEAREILASIVRDFGVGAVMVSALIGHSLDVLRTGLPTLIVAHDYYPLWPILFGDFGDASARFDAEALRAALPRADAGFPFAERDAGYWLALRTAYLDVLVSTKPVFVAPIAGVRDNAQRLAPELAALSWHIVPHGLAPFRRDDAATSARATTGDVAPSSATETSTIAVATSPTRARPRLLVIGRIAGGKGEALLAQLLPLLVGEMDVYLFGCGIEGERFFGLSGVHIQLNYARAELPAIVARIAPDLALLPSTVAETFSYALSELWALAVPVVATRLGSFAERIHEGVDGWLAAPDADDVAAVIRRVIAEPEARDAMRSRLRARMVRDTVAMAADYANLLPPRDDAPRELAVSLPSTDTLALADAAQRAHRLARQAATQRDEIAAQQRELEARAHWVARVERDGREQIATRDAMIDERTEERDRAVGAFLRLQADFEERSAWALALDRRRAELEYEFFFPPNRVFLKLTRIARRIARSLIFRTQRFAGLARRALGSLRTRGIVGTWQRAKQHFGGGGAALTLGIPETPELDAPFAPFTVPGSEKPRVSLVIPVYNHFRHTFTCLRSLAAHPGSVPFEAIVVDDCSSDETAQRLPLIGGIVVHRNAENLGFIGACNAGAALARGEYLVFLNNDTAVRPGWLEALVATFDARSDCGLAGAKLIYPDGRLQEAGGIVFNDASGWNFGRFDDPAHPQYNFVREADYCSGAAIMIRRELFERFGGFDTRYKPAYYEDTDLAFRVREAGLRVYYQPAAEVVHFEGISSGTDVASGTKRFQVINQDKFRERWADALTAQPAPGTPLARARAYRSRRQILIADACTPTPDQDSGSVRMVNLMRILIAEGWQVAFANENLSHDGRYTQALQQIGVEVLYRPHVGSIVSWLQERGSLLDSVMLSRHYVAAPLLPVVRQYAHHARVVFDTVDLHYLREERAAALENRADLARAAARTKALELRLVRECDVTIVVSPVERDLLRGELPNARVEVLSNVHEAIGAKHGFADRRDLYFVGGFQHPPNIDAVRWFVQDIWPRIASALPDAKFHIIGSRITDEVRALAGERVIVHGFVETLDAFLNDCRLSVAPLRYGAGVKGKVNQSMAHGQPVVATTIAVEGMHVVAGEDVMVADDPAEFADAVVRVYNDAALWDRLSRNGFANVAQHFSFDAARAAIAGIFPR